jgi:hypothetical protein
MTTLNYGSEVWFNKEKSVNGRHAERRGRKV